MLHRDEALWTAVVEPTVSAVVLGSMWWHQRGEFGAYPKGRLVLEEIAEHIGFFAPSALVSDFALRGRIDMTINRTLPCEIQSVRWNDRTTQGVLNIRKHHALLTRRGRVAWMTAVMWTLDKGYLATRDHDIQMIDSTAVGLVFGVGELLSTPINPLDLSLCSVKDIFAFFIMLKI